jgi:dTDP-glucose 4,6-dehydratase
MTILVTGGCGFIGSNFVRYLRNITNEPISILDKLTYAGSLQNIKGVPGVTVWVGDIANRDNVEEWLRGAAGATALFHFAAESHVDNSIADSAPFLQTNVIGTVNLLETIRKYLPDTKFIHVSTDEVYGSLCKDDPPFTEKTQYDPRSPYSASKAASDHFVNAYRATHGLKTIITNCSNNYGPYQHPEKFIPTVIRKAIAGEKVPVYGTGETVRDWLYVDDHCSALYQIAERGRIGEKYCIGGGYAQSNLRLACDILGYLGLGYDQIEFVTDRKGHDFRYDIDSEKLYLDTGWKPMMRFDRGLARTIDWYVRNPQWVKSCLAKSQLERSESFSQAESLLDSTLQLSRQRSKSCLSTTSR